MEETILLPTRTTPGIRRPASQTPMTRIVLSRFTPLKRPSISHFYRATSPPEPKSMANTRNLLSAAASLAASAVLARTIINDLLPHSVRHQFLSSLAGFFSRFSSELTIIIAEYNGFSCNDMYLAAETYLGTKVSPATRRLCVSKKDGEKHLEVTMERGEEVADVFEGVQFKWRLICRETQREVAMPESYMRKATMSEARSLELTFNKKHKAKAMDAYLPYILAQAKVIKAQDRSLKIHTLRLDYHPSNIADIWCPINLDHPATFDTLAMEAQLKREVIEDLERFVRRKEYYKKVGKAWKRGYLLYGPPGTGKSSLIAAMANYLRFDVYDLELAAVQSNSLLRSLLVGTGNQSILVVEDIDCSIDLANRDGEEGEKPVRSRVVFGRFGHHEEKVTLSGLLNFIDGLWSSCGDERIIVFTTNHKDRLDPALLRPGRMDMHIYMGYCGSDAFHTLLSNYHGVDATAHPRFNEIEGLLHEVQATPAEVAEELMKSDVADVALQGLVKFLQGKTREAASEQKDEGNICAEGERKVDELVQVVDLS